MDVVRVGTDDRDLLSAAFCPSIPTLIKPDSPLSSNAVWTISQHGRGRQSVRKKEWCRRGRQIYHLAAALQNVLVKATVEERGKTGCTVLFVPKDAQGEASRIGCPDRKIWLSSSKKVCKSAVSEALIVFCNEDE